jgi:AcrR family transcriptional regulator
MSSRPRKPGRAKPPAAHGSDRELRADARRNRDRVLLSAQVLFATEGLGVSLDEIARRAGVGPGTVHRHFPGKDALYLAAANEQLEQLVSEAEVLADTDDPAALFALLARIMTTGAQNAAVRSALVAAEFDLRTASPDVAADLKRHVADLLKRAQAADAVRHDLTAEEMMALVAGSLAAIRHAGAETSRPDSAHLAGIILDGIRPKPVYRCLDDSSPRRTRDLELPAVWFLTEAVWFLIRRWPPRRRQQAEPLQPTAFRAVAVLQRNVFQRDRVPVAPARGDDRHEGARPRPGLDPVPQCRLHVCHGMSDRHHDIVIVLWCDHPLHPSARALRPAPADQVEDAAQLPVGVLPAGLQFDIRHGRDLLGPG